MTDPDLTPQEAARQAAWGHFDPSYRVDWTRYEGFNTGFRAGWEARVAYSEQAGEAIDKFDANVVVPELQEDLRAAEQELERLRTTVADAERMYGRLCELLAPYKQPIESIIQPAAVVERLITELERLRKALTRIDNEVPSECHWHRMGDSMWANIGRLAARTARVALASPSDEEER